MIGGSVPVGRGWVHGRWGALFAAGALALGPACAFEDPNAPPPPDPCLQGDDSHESGLFWARIDGPAVCTDPSKADVVTHFTGSGWDEASALCRAKDLFFGAVPVGNAGTLAIERDLAVPSDAFGYCLINRGTPSESVAYSVCGVPAIGEISCEETLPQQANVELSAEWVSCPGGPRCPATAGAQDSCAGLGAADPSHAFALHVDVQALCCGASEAPDAGSALALADTRDSLFVSLGSGFGPHSAACTAASVHDSQGHLQYGIGAPALAAPAPRDAAGARVGGPGLDPALLGQPLGYCVFGADDDPYQFALFSLCGQALATDDPARFTPRALCEQGYPRVAGPRLGSWFDCPGAALCP